MTPVPFFLVPLALGSGFVLGWLLSWMRGMGTRRRLRDVRIVLLETVSRLAVYDKETSPIPWLTYKKFIGDLHRSLSGKERK